MNVALLIAFALPLTEPPDSVVQLSLLAGDQRVRLSDLKDSLVNEAWRAAESSEPRGRVGHSNYRQTIEGSYLVIEFRRGAPRSNHWSPTYAVVISEMIIGVRENKKRRLQLDLEKCFIVEHRTGDLWSIQGFKNVDVIPALEEALNRQFPPNLRVPRQRR